MLVNYRTGLNQKVNIADTLNMLSNYRTALTQKVNIADTAAMLTNYRNGLNQKLNIADTATMLNPYLRDADTTGMLANYRTTLNQKVNISDTLNMLSNYRSGLNQKANIADTANMLTNYRNGLNLKLNKADTATMLNPYLRDADTTSMLANYRTGLNQKVNISDTLNMLSNYRNTLTQKVNILDTSNMLTNYRMGLTQKVNIADTATMLNSYLKKSDTTSLNLTNRFNTKVNVSDFPQATVRGSIRYWNGSNWVVLAPGSTGQTLVISSSAGTLGWGCIVTNTAGAASSAPTLTANTVLTPITHSTTGATGIGTATGLPTGVTASWSANTITISGTPSSAGTFSYSIPLSGGCGNVNATGSITVNAACAAGAASSTPTLTVNTVLTNITHSTTIATGIGTASGLPAGVTAAWSANVITISGTPTATGTFNYTIPLTGTSCSSVNATGSITVSTFTCGSSTVSDIHGNIYNTVSIGTQCWMKENLRVRRYNDGSEIKFDASGGTAGNGTGQTWTGWTIGALTIYARDTSNLRIYGYLYNWYAAKGIDSTITINNKNICPTGWHVPSDSEWITLTSYLGGLSGSGGKMKSTGTTLWTSQSSGTDNSSGFTALPGGIRDGTTNGSFITIKTRTNFWSSTSYDSNLAYYRPLIHNSPGMTRSFDRNGYGYSVRCLKD
jgi:uncharacterized protein (TIGR02145 family)